MHVEVYHEAAAPQIVEAEETIRRFPAVPARWAKKIRQKLHYFGKVSDDPEGTAALERFNRDPRDGHSHRSTPGTVAQ